VKVHADLACSSLQIVSPELQERLAGGHFESARMGRSRPYDSHRVRKRGRKSEFTVLTFSARDHRLSRSVSTVIRKHGQRSVCATPGSGFVSAVETVWQG